MLAIIIAGKSFSIQITFLRSSHEAVDGSCVRFNSGILQRTPNKPLKRVLKFYHGSSVGVAWVNLAFDGQNSKSPV